MPSYIGKAECYQCGREVDVSENRSGMAYYRCAPCGIKVQQTNPRGNRMLIEKTQRFQDPDQAPPAAPAPAPEPRESREIAEPKPAAKTQQKTVNRKPAGFFFNGGN